MFSEAQIQQLSALITQPLNDIRDRLTSMEGRMTDMEGRMTGIEGRMTDMEGRMTGIEGRMTDMEGRMTGIEGRMTGIEDRLTGIEGRMTAVEIGHRRMNALHFNSTLGRTEQLIPIPREVDGLLPTDLGVPFPATLERLIVSGSETLPSVGVRNDWEKAKSIALLNFYGEDEATDNENEYSDRSRARRLRLAKKLGLSQSQLNFAQLTL